MSSSPAMLNGASVRSLTWPAGSSDRLVEGLFKAQYNRSLAELHFLRERLVAEAPGLCSRTGFGTAAARLSAHTTATQKQILSHPSVSYWTSVAWELVDRQAHIHFPEAHIRTHLRDFSRLPLAAVLVAGGGDYDCETMSNQLGFVPLAGAGYYLDFPGGPACEIVRARSSAGVIDARLSSDLSYAATLRPLPTVEGIEINAVDTDLHSAGQAGGPLDPLPPTRLASWQRVLITAWALIEDVWPALADEIRLGIRTIVPVVSPLAAVHRSASHHVAPGLVTMSFIDDPLVMAEAIVHEYHHQKLQALMAVDPLVAIQQDNAAHYSPWRPDPRPLRGLLHAVYTFIVIEEFYLRLLGSSSGAAIEPRVLQRIYTCRRQVDIGLDVLRDGAEFTPLGRNLLEAMTDHADILSARAPTVQKPIRQSIDDALLAHRKHWEDQYGAQSQKATAKYVPREPEMTDDADVETRQLELALLESLMLPTSIDLSSLIAVVDPWDPILACVRETLSDHQQRHVLSLSAVVRPGQSLLLDLICGHIAYIREDFATAARHYRLLLCRYPRSPYLWRIYAFALRHTDKPRESVAILAHLPHLPAETVAGTQSPDDHIESLTARMVAGAPCQDQPGGHAEPVTLDERSQVLARYLNTSRYRQVLEFAPDGGQLPSLIAVASRLKPAMDLWVSPSQWGPLMDFIRERGLRYYVESYFDPHSAEIDKVASDSFTTTRAAMVTTFTDAAQAHVFLANTPERLRDVVESGWYPLVIGGMLIQDHVPHPVRFGTALGYPACCTRFFAQRNDWNNDNTFYASWHNTVGRPNYLCNGFLRHRMFSLAAHIPCSAACPSTLDYSRRLLTVIASEAPAYAAEIERHLRSPVLSLSELRVYRFTGAVAGGARIEYSDVEHVFSMGNAGDALFESLRNGDACEMSDNVVRIFLGGRQVAAYRARGDQNGPEVPVIADWR